VPGAAQFHLLPAVVQSGYQGVVLTAAGRSDLGGAQVEPAPAGASAFRRGRQILVGEGLPQLLGSDLPALGLGVLLHDAGELDLQPARQIQVMGGGQQVRYPALTGLGVDPDDRLVGAPDIAGVDRQVRDIPGDQGIAPGAGDPFLADLEPLVDGVLVGPGEGGVDQVAAIGVPGVDLHLVAVLRGAPDAVDVGEVDQWIDALAVQVHPECDQVH